MVLNNNLSLPDRLYTAGYVERFYSITCALVEAYFAPTSRSRMSKNFRDSESLGKSNVKKWSQNWTFLLGSGLKSPRKKKFFFADFVLQNIVKTTLSDGLETYGRRSYRKFWHISRRFWVFSFMIIFSVFQKNWVFGYSWYRCYYLHRSRDSLSPVCRIFFSLTRKT